MWKYSILVKIKESLLCVTNHSIKVTSKLILPSVSKLKFCPYYKSTLKLIFIQCNSIKVSLKPIKHLLTVLKLITTMSEQYGVIYFPQRNSEKLVCSAGK